MDPLDKLVLVTSPARQHLHLLAIERGWHAGMADNMYGKNITRNWLEFSAGLLLSDNTHKCHNRQELGIEALETGSSSSGSTCHEIEQCAKHTYSGHTCAAKM